MQLRLPPGEWVPRPAIDFVLNGSSDDPIPDEPEAFVLLEHPQRPALCIVPLYAFTDRRR